MKIIVKVWLKLINHSAVGIPTNTNCKIWLNNFESFIHIWILRFACKYDLLYKYAYFPLWSILCIISILTTMISLKKHEINIYKITKTTEGYISFLNQNEDSFC